MASQGLGYPRDRAFSWRELADVIANSEN
jgi:hypothetical protein